MSDTAWAWVSIVGLFLFGVALALVYSHFQKNRHFGWARFAARVAIFAAISTILYVVPVFQIKLPFAPTFMSLHFDEVPAMIAGYAYGPFVGEMVILVKTLIKLPTSSTMCVGELADFLFSTAYVFPATWIYKKIRNMKGVFIGFGVATVLQVAVAMTLNVYMILPFYIYMMGFSQETIMNMCQAAMPQIKDLGWSYAFFGVMPLNLIKDASVFAITFVVYRSIRKVLHWEDAPAAVSPAHPEEKEAK